MTDVNFNQKTDDDLVAKAADPAPWEKFPDFAKMADGITFYQNDDRSGLHVSHENNEKIDPAWREPNGWYEGPEKWSVVAVNFPGSFDSEDAATAHQTAQKAFPEAIRPSRTKCSKTRTKVWASGK